jgi:histone-lysine N-methyltransferase SETMAR
MHVSKESAACELSRILYYEKQEKPRRAIQNKRRGMLTYGVVLLLDNALPHTSTAARTRALLEHLDWELFDHHPYSPDLFPSDYNLFTCLMNWFGSKRLTGGYFLNNLCTKILISRLNKITFWKYYRSL